VAESHRQLRSQKQREAACAAYYRLEFYRGFTEDLVCTMTEDEVIASLKGIINRCALYKVDPEYKFAIRQLLRIIDIALTT
jgi:hypothetical protein